MIFIDELLTISIRCSFSFLTRIVFAHKRTFLSQWINPGISRMNKMQCINCSRERIQPLLQHQGATLVIFQSCFSSQTSRIHVYVVCCSLPIMLVQLKCIEQLIQVWFCRNIWSFSLHITQWKFCRLKKISKINTTWFITPIRTSFLFFDQE